MFRRCTPPQLAALVLISLVAGCDNAQKAQSSTGPNSGGTPLTANAGATTPATQPAADTKSPALASAPETGGSKITVSAASEEIEISGYVFAVPPGWVRQEPSMQSRLAQFGLPGESGPAEFTVSYFGPTGAGPRDANVQRWVGQFQNPSGADAAVNSHTATIDANGLVHTVVTVTGTYAPPAMGRPVAAEPQTDYALYGVILEGGPKGPLYLTARGPRKTIDAQTEVLKKFHMTAHAAK